LELVVSCAPPCLCKLCSALAQLSHRHPVSSQPMVATRPRNPTNANWTLTPSTSLEIVPRWGRESQSPTFASRLTAAAHLLIAQITCEDALRMVKARDAAAGVSTAGAVSGARMEPTRM
jgi:hypothetical protein